MRAGRQASIHKVSGAHKIKEFSNVNIKTLSDWKIKFEKGGSFMDRRGGVIN